MSKVAKFKRLFFDIETSPNLVFSWRVGNKINIDYNSIVNERAIICICWKFEGESKVHSLSWDKGNDKKMIQEFAKVMNTADEIVGHNSDNFDVKWVRTRCLKYGIPMIPDFQSIDTLKLSREGFNFNSNKLDYISKFLGIGKKNATGFGLWRDIVLNNSSKAMKVMVEYCKNDVVLLEDVFKRLNPYVKAKVHRAMLDGGLRIHCPECSGTHCISNGIRVTAAGTANRRLHCQDCGKYHSMPDKQYLKLTK
jgi:DNA polymerase elongation subunit (family B)